jgi:hypothetical protein
MLRKKLFWILLFMVLVVSGCNNDGSGGSGLNRDTGWMRQVENPLVIAGLTDTTLDFGPADPSVLYDEQDNLWKVWFSSTLMDIASESEIMTIKYAHSKDGITWSDPQIVLQAASDTTAWDHTHIETPAVIKNPDPHAPPGQKFILWYSGANTTLASGENRPTTFPYYQIGMAYSADGLSFTRYTPGLNNKPGLALVAEAGLFGSRLPGVFGDGVVADPEVIYRDKRFYMWFSSYAEFVPEPVTASGRSPLAFGIALVTSSDGINWSTNHDNPLLSLAKPGEVAAGQQPSVLFNPDTDQYEMWFSNDSDTETSTPPCNFNTVNGFWRAVSNDGINWTPDYSARDLTYDTRHGYESLGFLTGIEVAYVNGTYRAYYCAWGADHIPDDTVYLCPDRQGGLIPAVLSLNLATFTLP